jgi:glycosyltransferase involved in cell wall biosynthesis
MPRVAWLFEFPTLLGGERSLLTCLDAIRLAGYQPTALAPPDGPLADALGAAGVPVVAWDARGQAAGRRPLAELRNELTSILETLRPDLLHANSLSMGRLAGPVAAALRLPCLAHLRDIVGLSAAAVADLARCSRLVAVSQATRGYQVAQGLPAEKTAVLHNGVDLARFAPRKPTGGLARELDLPSGALLAGTIGQIVLRKGHDVLVAAAGSLRDVLPHLHFAIMGSCRSTKDEAARHVDKLHAAIAHLGLAGRFHWLGERDDVERLLPELDLLVHPARQEPLGRVLLEAAACGVPIVATDVGGTREIFPSEAVAARLVPAGDPAALAGAIRELAADPSARARLGHNARRRAESAFDRETAAAGLVKLYDEALCVAREPPGG